MSFDPILSDATFWGVEARRINNDFQQIWAALESLSPQTLNPVLSVNNSLPDLEGNVIITATSIGAIPILAVGDSVAPLNNEHKVDFRFLPSNFNLEGLLFQGLAVRDTDPKIGFYIATQYGTYINFLSNSVPLVVSQTEFNQGYVILYYSNNNWNKFIMLYPTYVQASVTWDSIEDKPLFASVATTGLFSDLSDIPNLLLEEDKGVPGGLATLDNQGKVLDSQIRDAIFNRSGFLFGGFISTSSNPAVIISTTTSGLYFVPTVPGTYINFGSIRVETAELNSGIVLIEYNRTSFVKTIYNYPEFQNYPPHFVVSVNGLEGYVTLTASDVGAIPESEKDVPYGIPTLDEYGKISPSLMYYEQVSAAIRYKGLLENSQQLSSSHGFYFAYTVGEYQCEEGSQRFTINPQDLIDNVVMIVQQEQSSEISSIWIPIQGFKALYEFSTESVTEIEPYNLEDATSVFNSLSVKTFKHPLKDNTVIAILADEAPTEIIQDRSKIDLASWLGIITAFLQHYDIPYIYRSVVALLENPPQALQVQYSEDAIKWHSTYRSTDIWRREKVGQSDWSAPMYIGGNGDRLVLSQVEPAENQADYWLQVSL